MMKLLVDQGNTRLKCAILNNQEIQQLKGDHIAAVMKEIKGTLGQIDGVWVASVRNNQIRMRLQQQLTKYFSNIQFAKTESSRFGLQNSYESPENMGVDRWLAMLGLWWRHKQGFILIDAGTALTVDVVNDRGEHLGGHILPGMQMQQQSLQQQTDRVRFEMAREPEQCLGQDTASAVLNASLVASLAYIERIQSTYAQFELYLTGGDADLLDEHLNVAVNKTTNLVFDGLVAQFSGPIGRTL